MKGTLQERFAQVRPVRQRARHKVELFLIARHGWCSGVVEGLAPAPAPVPPPSTPQAQEKGHRRRRARRWVSAFIRSRHSLLTRDGLPQPEALELEALSIRARARARVRALLDRWQGSAAARAELDAARSEESVSQPLCDVEPPWHFGGCGGCCVESVGCRARERIRAFVASRGGAGCSAADDACIAVQLAKDARYEPRPAEAWLQAAMERQRKQVLWLEAQSVGCQVDLQLTRPRADQLWWFRCRCGVERVCYDDGQLQWECECCNTWQHAACAVASPHWLPQGGAPDAAQRLEAAGILSNGRKTTVAPVTAANGCNIGPDCSAHGTDCDDKTATGTAHSSKQKRKHVHDPNPALASALSRVDRLVEGTNVEVRWRLSTGELYWWPATIWALLSLADASAASREMLASSILNVDVDSRPAVSAALVVYAAKDGHQVQLVEALLCSSGLLFDPTNPKAAPLEWRWPHAGRGARRRRHSRGVTSMLSRQERQLVQQQQRAWQMQQKAIGNMPHSNSSKRRKLEHKSPESAAPKPLPGPPKGYMCDRCYEEQKAEEAHRAATANQHWLITQSASTPDDAIFSILQFLDGRSVARFALTSAKLAQILAAREDLWRAMAYLFAARSKAEAIRGKRDLRCWVLPSRPRKTWMKVLLGCLADDAKSRKDASDKVIMTAAKMLSRAGDPVGRLCSLLDKHPWYDINYASPVYLEAAPLINLAAYYRCRKCVERLAARGAMLNLRDKGGFSPLMNAAWAGDSAIVRVLLSLGARRDITGAGHMSGSLQQSEHAMNAEHWARARGHLAVADMIAHYMQPPPVQQYTGPHGAQAQAQAQAQARTCT